VGRRGEVPVPRGAPAVDCTGLAISAGFWNSHVHFFERKWANAAEIPAPELERQLGDMLTRYGFTSVFDTGSSWENTRRIRDRIESGEVAGPRIRSTGPGLLPPNALPSDTVLAMMGVMKFPAPEVSSPEQARAAARALLDDGVDGIKLFASSARSAPMSEATIRGATDEARRAGKPSFVHPNTGADLLTAVRAGVEIVAHTTPHSEPWDQTILSAMCEQGVALTPTLTLWKYYARHDRISTQDRVTETACGQLRSWLELGGAVLFGTDLGAVEYDPSEEYRLMAHAGMRLGEILASLTTAPAERFGKAERVGRVAPGFEADLTVWKPAADGDMRALADVRYTVRTGKIAYQEAQP
jgi:imidazolonepropionase-like amidohydrolase